MNKPPFSFPPADWLQQLSARLPAPPAWLQAELHNRLVLLLNHVLQQEPQAMERLRRQAGKRLLLRWANIELVLQPTAVGLLALADAGTEPDLRLRVLESAPWSLAQTVLAGEKPAVDIQGDVQFAAEVAWLADNLRWDLEEDLSRVLGDVMAHRLVGLGRMVLDTLRGFLSQASERVRQTTGMGSPS